MADGDERQDAGEDRHVQRRAGHTLVGLAQPGEPVGLVHRLRQQEAGARVHLLLQEAALALEVGGVRRDGGAGEERRGLADRGAGAVAPAVELVGDQRQQARRRHVDVARALRVVADRDGVADAHEQVADAQRVCAEQVSLQPQQVAVLGWGSAARSRPRAAPPRGGRRPRRSCASSPWASRPRRSRRRRRRAACRRRPRALAALVDLGGSISTAMTNRPASSAAASAVDAGAGRVRLRRVGRGLDALRDLYPRWRPRLQRRRDRRRCARARCRSSRPRPPPPPRRTRGRARRRSPAWPGTRSARRPRPDRPRSAGRRAAGRRRPGASRAPRAAPGGSLAAVHADRVGAELDEPRGHLSGVSPSSVRSSRVKVADAMTATPGAAVRAAASACSISRRSLCVSIDHEVRAPRRARPPVRRRRRGRPRGRRARTAPAARRAAHRPADHRRAGARARSTRPRG